MTLHPSQKFINLDSTPLSPQFIHDPHASAVTRGAFAPDGSRVVSGSFDLCARQLSLTPSHTPTHSRTFTLSHSHANSLNLTLSHFLSHALSHILTLTLTLTLTLAPSHPLALSPSHSRTLAPSHSRTLTHSCNGFGRSAGVGCSDRRAEAGYEVCHGCHSRTLVLTHTLTLSLSLSLSHSLSHSHSLTLSPGLRVWDAATGEQTLAMKCAMAVYAAAWSPDGTLHNLLSITYDSRSTPHCNPVATP